MNKYNLSYAIGMSNLSQNEACILNLFVLMSDQQYKCFPSVATITKITKMCTTSYKKAINNLIDMGLVHRQFRYNRETGQQRSNYFYLNSLLFSGDQNGITIFINKAKLALNKKKSTKQIQLPLTACKEAHAKSFKSIKKAANQLTSPAKRLFHHTQRSRSKISCLWAFICKSKKNHGKNIILNKNKFNFRKILNLFRGSVSKEAQMSFIFHREGSRDDHIYFNFLSRKRKI